MRHQYLKKLNSIEEVLGWCRFNRILSRPFRYLIAHFHKRIIYPFSLSGITISFKLFTGSKFKVLLPSGLDIYLWQTKPHPSELRLTKFIIKALPDGGLFVDVGAHFGYFSKLAQDLNAEVISYEASKNTFAVLEKNFIDESQVKIHNLAIGDCVGEVDFIEYPLEYAEYNSTVNHVSIKGTTTTVKMKTLDSCLSHKPKIDVLKVDVEGAELNVLAGMSSILSDQICSYIILEFIKTTDPSEIDKCVDILNNSGYTPCAIQENGEIQPINNLRSHLNSLQWESDNIVFHVKEVV